MTYSNQSESKEMAEVAMMASATATPRSNPRSFRYSYLCRLIDDSELECVDPSLRSELRRAHKQAYWKNLSLLRRDAAQVLKVRRSRMSSQQQWDFNGLVGDYTKVQFLLATLTMAGLSHSTRITVGLNRARIACSEFETLFSASPLLAAAA